MSENFFQIDKKDVISKFKEYAKKHSEKSDEYNPKNAKQVANHRNYFILDRIRALYHWVIKEAKLDLRRMYIHNDKEFKGSLKLEAGTYIIKVFNDDNQGSYSLAVGDIEFFGANILEDMMISI